MKTVFYLNNKKVTRARVELIIGKEKLADKIAAAKETFIEDPYIENSWFLGSAGMLTICFE